jgi:uncharacterized protein (DUF1499 family)
VRPGPGLRGGRLAPCPRSPNCVSSDDPDPSRQEAPWRIRALPGEAWAIVRAVVGRQPRTTVTADTGEYLHAECKSRLWGFTDDLELHLRPAGGVIAVRSAARLGWSDFGVNRRRVAALHAALREAGAVW